MPKNDQTRDVPIPLELLEDIDRFKASRGHRSRAGALADLIGKGLAYAWCEDAGAPMDKVTAGILVRDARKSLDELEAKARHNGKTTPCSL